MNDLSGESERERGKLSAGATKEIRGILPCHISNLTSTYELLFLYICFSHCRTFEKKLLPFIMTGTIRVAVTQAEPGWFDLAGALKKTCDLITEAAANGAELIVFPECWIPGYPCWIWYASNMCDFSGAKLTIIRTRLVDFDLGVKYIKNSLVVDSVEMETIRECAAQNKIIVSLGFSENDGNSLYIAQCTIGSDGQIQMHRRKIKPTHMERTIFGDGSGSSLLNVVSTKIGKIGALSCWEHIQPLLKYHTLSQGEEIHVAAWPPLSPHSGGPEFWSMSAEGERHLDVYSPPLIVLQVVRIFLRRTLLNHKHSFCIVRLLLLRRVLTRIEPLQEL